MANDPSYVRLVPRLQGGMVCDVQGSGWSISGLDVKEFPKDSTQAARYVRNALDKGLLEPAGKAEYEDAHDTALEEEVLRQNPEYKEKASAVQEAQIQKVAQEATAKAAERLGADEDAEFEAELEEAEEDRQERLAEAKEKGLDNDDPEAQAERNFSRRSTAAERAKKSKKKTKKAAASE